MDLVSILGLIGTVIGLVRALPQLVRLLRAGEAYGVSVDTAATSSIVSFGWSFYGILTAQPYVTLATGASGTIFLMISFLSLRYGRKIREVKVAPVWLVVLLLSYLVKGAHGLGIVLPVSVLVSNTPQLWIAYRESDLSDLSLGTWLLSISDGLIWGLYSFIQHDTSIMVFALFQLTTSSLIVLLKLMHRAKMNKKVLD